MIDMDILTYSILIAGTFSIPIIVIWWIRFRKTLLGIFSGEQLSTFTDYVGAFTIIIMHICAFITIILLIEYL